jgi:hypothetical protein
MMRSVDLQRPQPDQPTVNYGRQLARERMNRAGARLNIELYRKLLTRGNGRLYPHRSKAAVMALAERTGGCNERCLF